MSCLLAKDTQNTFLNSVNSLHSSAGIQKLAIAKISSLAFGNVVVLGMADCL